MDPMVETQEKDAEKARIEAETKAFKDRIDKEMDQEYAERAANLENLERQEQEEKTREAMVLEAYNKARFIEHFMEHRFELYEAISSDESRASARRAAAEALWQGAFGHLDDRLFRDFPGLTD